MTPPPIRLADNLAVLGSASTNLQASAPPDDSSTAARQTLGLRSLRTWTSAFEVCNMATLPLRHPRDRIASCPLIKICQIIRHGRMKSSGFLKSVSSLSLGPKVSSFPNTAFSKPLHKNDRALAILATPWSSPQDVTLRIHVGKMILNYCGWLASWINSGTPLV